jgi:hypothetical protein
MNRTIRRQFAAGLLLAMMATTALAEESGAQRLQRAPALRAGIAACMSDRVRLCADVAPGQGRIVRCLARQPDQLSVACAAAMQKASDALIAAGAAMRPGLISQ